jgi:hypothetical protein
MNLFLVFGISVFRCLSVLLSLTCRHPNKLTRRTVPRYFRQVVHELQRSALGSSTPALLGGMCFPRRVNWGGRPWWLCSTSSFLPTTLEGYVHLILHLTTLTL